MPLLTLQIRMSMSVTITPGCDITVYKVSHLAGKVVAVAQSREKVVTDRFPVPWVLRNDYCHCRLVYGNKQCWRAICKECGNYLALHLATRELAQTQADHLIATGHRCGRFRRSDKVHEAAIKDAQEKGRLRGAW